VFRQNPGVAARRSRAPGPVAGGAHGFDGGTAPARHDLLAGIDLAIDLRVSPVVGAADAPRVVAIEDRITLTK
jgi:hypothetical protein